MNDMAMRTAPRVVQDQELRYYTEASKRGVFYLRSLPDRDVLDAARDETSAAHTAVGIHIDPNTWTNPSWVTAQEAGTVARNWRLDHERGTGVSEVPGIHDLAAWEAYYGELPAWHRHGCACGDASPEGCGQLVFGYPYCRSCGDHHRMPECAVNEHGEALAQCGHTWAEVDKPDHYDWCGQDA
jgi:hypothetical protein